MSTTKLGPYIQKLMTVILDSEQEEFVKTLAYTELRRLNCNVEEFLNKNKSDDNISKKEKILLQEKMIKIKQQKQESNNG